AWDSRSSDQREGHPSIQASFLRLAIQFGHVCKSLPHVLLPSEMPAPHLGHEECVISFGALLSCRRGKCQCWSMN
ncbi:hypothetical protein D0859_12475, partial [Hortaea werneckii]